MKTKMLVALGSLCGALVLYCCADAMNGAMNPDGGGAVGDAGAQGSPGACCTPIFSTVSQGTLNTSTLEESFAGDLDTSAVRSLIIYTEAQHIACDFAVSFLPTPSGDTTMSVGVVAKAGQPVSVLGPRAFIQLRDDNGCGGVPVNYLLLGAI